MLLRKAEDWSPAYEAIKLDWVDLLKTLREAETVIRVHYPEAHRAPAINLAAQGCHVRALRKRDEAVGPLASASHLMMLHDVAVEASIVKVAELLADSYSACGAVDDALFILYCLRQRRVDPPSKVVPTPR